MGGWVVIGEGESEEMILLELAFVTLDIENISCFSSGTRTMITTVAVVVVGVGVV